MDTDGEEFESAIALMFTVGSEGSYEWLVTDEDFDLLKLCPEIVVGKYVAVTSIDSSQLIPTDKETAAGWQSRARIAYLPSTTALCPWGCPLLLEHNKAPENCLIAAIASTSAYVPCLQAHPIHNPPTRTADRESLRFSPSQDQGGNRRDTQGIVSPCAWRRIYNCAGVRLLPSKPRGPSSREMPQNLGDRGRWWVDSAHSHQRQAIREYSVCRESQTKDSGVLAFGLFPAHLSLEG